MALKGDIRELPRLMARLQALTTPALREAVAKRMGAAALKLVADEFRQTRNPYGEQWRPLAAPRRRQGRKRGRADKPLNDTGRLRASFAPGLESGPWGFSIATAVEYASPHQYGSKKVPNRPPQRQILPMAETGGLGPIWGPALMAEGERAIRDFMKDAAG